MSTKSNWSLAILSGAALALAVVASQSAAEEGESTPFYLKARLSGFQEVPAVSSTARGSFRVWRDEETGEVSFRLSYSGLEAAVTVAHIHFGQRGANGGVMVALCGGSKPACAPSPGVVTGTITETDIAGPAGQGIAAGEFAEALRALVSGNTYANVHSSKFPGGEIRGQIVPASH